MRSNLFIIDLNFRAKIGDNVISIDFVWEQKQLHLNMHRTNDQIILTVMSAVDW